MASLDVTHSGRFIGGDSAKRREMLLKPVEIEPLRIVLRRNSEDVLVQSSASACPNDDFQSAGPGKENRPIFYHIVVRNIQSSSLTTLCAPSPKVSNLDNWHRPFFAGRKFLECQTIQEVSD